MKYLDLAARLALGNKDHDDRSFLLAAVALRQDGAVVVATNVMTKTPMHGAHAEARVLRKAGFGATLWVARVYRDGTWAISKPCAKCQALIKNKRVKKVYYTIDKDSYGVWNVS